MSTPVLAMGLDAVFPAVVRLNDTAWQNGSRNAPWEDAGTPHLVGIEDPAPLVHALSGEGIASGPVVGVRPPGWDERVQAECWCHRERRWVDLAEVRAGRTVSCGRRMCFERKAPA